MSGSLDARQRAMLAEMGIRLWLPPERTAAPEAVPAARDALSERRPAAPFATKSEADKGHETVATVRMDEESGAPRTRTLAAADTPVPAVAAGTRTPRPAGVESMDWPALQAAVAGCRACGLCEGRTQTVFGVGAQRADWMVVGEAPGETEDRRGEPFVGQAGQLLDNMLAAIGLSRQAPVAPDSGAEDAGRNSVNARNDGKQGVYIANVLKCRPPGNRNPQPDEVAQCEPYLRRQVALVQPKIILAMGRFAVQSLLQTSEPVGRLRGQVHHYQGVPVVVTYHPAYLLRALPEKAKAWSDLCLARSVLAQTPATA